eukprot:365018-Chlamydomonas_euryale.AAC.5
MQQRKRRDLCDHALRRRLRAPVAKHVDKQRSVLQPRRRVEVSAGEVLEGVAGRQRGLLADNGVVWLEWDVHKHLALVVLAEAAARGSGEGDEHE